MNQDPAEFLLFTEIGIIDQLAGNAFERAMPAGLTRAQFTVLHHLARRTDPAQSPAQLAAAIQVSRATMTSTLARLSKRGLIAIEPDPRDGRGKLVCLTDAGRKMREACIAAVVPMLPLVATALKPEEAERLLVLLRKLRIALDAARD